MDAWRISDWLEVESEAENAEAYADELIAQLEADYPGDLLHQMVKQGGRREAP